VALKRITVDPNQMEGVPCIRNLRIPVTTVINMLAEGLTEKEILDLYPDLEPEDIKEALRFAAELLWEKTQYLDKIESFQSQVDV